MPLNISMPSQDSSKLVFRSFSMALEVKEDPSVPAGSGKEVFRNVLTVVVGNRACDILSVSEPKLGLASEEFIQARFGDANIGQIYGLDQAFPLLLTGQTFSPLGAEGSKHEDGSSAWVCAGPWVSINWANPGAAFPNIVVSETTNEPLQYGQIGFASAVRYKTVAKTTTDDEEYRHIFNVQVKRKLFKITGPVIPEQGIHTQNFLRASFRGSARRRINSLARVDNSFPFPFQMVRQDFQLDTEEGIQIYWETRHFSSVGPWVDLDRT